MPEVLNTRPDRLDCRHASCNGQLVEDAEDSALPPHIDPYECGICGERYLYDRYDETMEVDA